jgi:signal peptidase I
MAQVVAGPATLLPTCRTLRAPLTGINPPAVRHLLRGLNMTANLLATVAMLAFAGLALGPQFLGYRTQTMLTGSMAPRIETGDVLVAREVPAHDLAVGDVISYHIPIGDHRVESHRVVSIAPAPGGGLLVRTKGDANSAVDPWTALIDTDTVLKMDFVIPRIGTVIRVLRQPGIAPALHFGAPALFAVLILYSIWTRDEARSRTASGRRS